jgi:hypothetical protein
MKFSRFKPLQPQEKRKFQSIQTEIKAHLQLSIECPGCNSSRAFQVAPRFGAITPPHSKPLLVVIFPHIKSLDMYRNVPHHAHANPCHRNFWWRCTFVSTYDWANYAPIITPRSSGQPRISSKYKTLHSPHVFLFQ